MELALEDAYDLVVRLGLDAAPRWCRQNGITPGGSLDLIRRLLDRSCQRTTALAPVVESVHGHLMEPLALSYEDAGRALGVKTRTIQRIVSRGELRIITVSGSPRIPVDELRSYMNRQLEPA